MSEIGELLLLRSHHYHYDLVMMMNAHLRIAHNYNCFGCELYMMMMMMILMIQRNDIETIIMMKKEGWTGGRESTRIDLQL